MKNVCVGLVLVLLAACAGNRARDEALNPIAKTVWPQVRADFDRGVADGLADGDLKQAAADDLLSLRDDLTSALDIGDRAGLMGIPWESKMAQWAVRGIQADIEAGTVGPNTATILLQRITNFTNTIAVLQGRSVLLSASRERVGEERNPYVRTPIERRLVASLGGAP